jgi:hypothetical protein
VTSSVCPVIGRSAVYMEYNIGPRILPCGTPDKTGYNSV